ncbi:MAG: outer membrane lipoprotein-sorting protein [Spirochaetales bacterium]|nr:outer membrane lipoprotein-sorting protein [Spirochaetales bacterium]
MKHLPLLYFLLLPVMIQAQEYIDLLQKARIFSDSQNLRLICDLEITKPEGKKERQLEVYLNQKGLNYNVLIQVLTPGFLRKTKFLSVHENNTVTQWMSSSRGVKRLGNSNSSDSLFDSDFTVEDLSPLKLNDYTIETSSQKDQERLIKYILEPKLKNPDYDRKIITLNPDTCLIESIIYLKNSQIIKEYQLLKTEIKDSKSITTKCQMESKTNHSVSIITISDYEILESIPSRIFNKGNL